MPSATELEFDERISAVQTHRAIHRQQPGIQQQPVRRQVIIKPLIDANER